MYVGFIGLGAMGKGMATNLAKANLLSGVYNRTTSTAQAIAAELAVTLYSDISTLAADMDVLLICVSADSDLLAVVEAIAETVKSGAVVVDMSTVSSETAKQAANLLQTKGVAFLDAPVSGGVEGAINGSLSIMIGGDAVIVEKVRPVLEAMSSRIIHIGEVGSGQATKAVNQVMCAGINQAVTEALAFAAAQNLPMEKVLAAVAGGAAGNWFLDKRGSTMTNGTFAPGFKLALHHKDLHICQTMAAQAGISIPLSDMTVLAYQQLMADGFGDEDISALYRLKQPA